jgi:hypothetical protein
MSWQDVHIAYPGFQHFQSLGVLMVLRVLLSPEKDGNKYVKEFSCLELAFLEHTSGALPQNYPAW